MKKQTIFEFALDAPLDDARREVIERAIEDAAETHETDLEYGWEEGNAHRLHVFIKPVEIEIRFDQDRAEILAAAPIWAKAGFNQARKAAVAEMIEDVLRQARMISRKRAG